MARGSTQRNKRKRRLSLKAVWLAVLGGVGPWCAYAQDPATPYAVVLGSVRQQTAAEAFAQKLNKDSVPVGWLKAPSAEGDRFRVCTGPYMGSVVGRVRDSLKQATSLPDLWLVALSADQTRELARQTGLPLPSYLQPPPPPQAEAPRPVFLPLPPDTLDGLLLTLRKTVLALRQQQWDELTELLSPEQPLVVYYTAGSTVAFELVRNLPQLYELPPWHAPNALELWQQDLDRLIAQDPLLDINVHLPDGTLLPPLLVHLWADTATLHTRTAAALKAATLADTLTTHERQELALTDHRLNGAVYHSQNQKIQALLLQRRQGRWHLVGLNMTDTPK